MRSAILLAVAASLAASGVAAQDFGPLANRVVHYDGAQLQNQILAAQAVCRDAAISQVRSERFADLFTESPLQMIVDAGLDAATNHIRSRRAMRDSINDCMARRGYVPLDATADDVAPAAPKSDDPDYWATVPRFGLSPSSATTSVTSVDSAGNAVTNFTVGRF